MELSPLVFYHDAQAGGFYPQSHAGIDVSQLLTRQNTLLEGIRGTGKTHVLRMLERYCLEEFHENRVLPVYVSLAQLSEHVKKEPDSFRVHLYAHVVKRAVQSAEENRTHLACEPSVLEKVGTRLAALLGLQTTSSIDELLANVRRISERLLFRLQYDLTTETLRQETRISASEQSKLSVGDPKALGVGATSEASVEVADDVTAVYMGHRLVHRDAASFLLVFLQHMQKLLNLEHVLVLLDECSEASQPAQSEIFRLFKTLRGAQALDGKKNCSYFVGSVYPRGQTYYPSLDEDGFSFEPGQDCAVEYLQWDETDLESYLGFFKEMTLNRVRELAGYRGDFPALCSELFDHEDAFTLAAYGAHGLPRRFWEIMKRGYDRSHHKIRLNRIAIAIQEIARDQILGHQCLGEDDEKLIDHLVQQLTRINQTNRASRWRPQNIYFSVQRSSAPLLRRLIMQGAIHDKLRMRTPDVRALPQPIYALDMAVVYSYKVILQLSFVPAVTSSLPQCAKGDFDQAPMLSKVALKQIYEDRLEGRKVSRQGSASDGGGDRGIGEDAAALPRGTDVVRVEGILRTLLPTFGRVELMDSGLLVSFVREQVDQALLQTLKVSDRVSLELIEGLRGWEVTKVLPATPPEKLQSQDSDRIREVGVFVERFLTNAARPVHLANIAHAVRSHFGDIVENTAWFGFGGFKAMLLSLHIEGMMVSDVPPGSAQIQPRARVSRVPPPGNGPFFDEVRRAIVGFVRHAGGTIAMTTLGEKLGEQFPGDAKVHKRLGHRNLTILLDAVAEVDVSDGYAVLRNGHK